MNYVKFYKGHLGAIARAKRIRQVQAAATLGVSNTSISLWFNGFRPISERFQQPIADMLEIPVSVVIKAYKKPKPRRKKPYGRKTASG